MPLSLSSKEVGQFAVLQETMLSPLEHESVEEWCRDVLRLGERMFSADRSAFVIATPQRFRHVSESLPPEHLKAYRERIAAVGPEGIEFSDGQIARVWERMRAEHLEAWTMDSLHRLVETTPETVAFYNDVIVPAGIAHSYAVSVGFPGGEAVLGMGHSRPSDDPWGEEAGLQLASLLLPAFTVGVGVVARWHAQRESLSRIGDQLGGAIALISPGGEQLYRSLRLRELLAADPERSVLEGEILRVAAEVADVRFTRSWRLPGPAGHHVVDTVTAHYALRGSLVDRGVVGPQDAVLVSVERLTPVLPSPRVLTERYGLTSRQAEVALFLARGLSNADIALRMRLSEHTVRHHAEWVFDKLEIHSRKALALKLLEEVSTNGQAGR